MLLIGQRSAKKIKGVAASFFLLALLSTPLLVVFWAAQAENSSRENVLANGNAATATVTRSIQFKLMRGCAFDYEFTVQGVTYEGGKGGCSLVKDYPAGSTLEIRYLASDPQVSHAPGADMWPGWVIVPFLIGIPLLFLFGVLIFEILVRNGRGSRRKQHRAGS